MVEIDLGLFEKANAFKKEVAQNNSIIAQANKHTDDRLSLKPDFSGVYSVVDILKSEMPRKLSETIRTARKVLEGMGIPSNAHIEFYPSEMVEKEDNEVDKRSSGIYKEFDGRNIDSNNALFTGNPHALALTSENMLFAIESYTGPFFDEFGPAEEEVSLAAISFFSSFLNLAITSSAREVELSEDQPIASEFLSDAFAFFDKRAYRTKDPKSFLKASAEIRKELLKQGGFRIVGKGAQFVLMRDDLHFTSKNSLGEAKIVNFILAFGMNEFVKKMKKDFDWFVVPDKMSEELRNKYEDNVNLAPAIEEIRQIVPGVSTRQLIQDYLSSKVSVLAFERDHGVLTVKDPAAVVTGNDCYVENKPNIEEEKVTSEKFEDIFKPSRKEKKSKKDKKPSKKSSGVTLKSYVNEAKTAVSSSKKAREHKIGGSLVAQEVTTDENVTQQGQVLREGVSERVNQGEEEEKVIPEVEENFEQEVALGNLVVRDGLIIVESLIDFRKRIWTAGASVRISELKDKNLPQ